MYQLAIVDDNEAWCFAMAHLLGQHGYAVATFTNADAFLREAARFDLALIDFSMPPRRYQRETDGPDVIRRVRQQLANPPLLVLISSYFTEDVTQQGLDLALEPDRYIAKGVDSAYLVQQIGQLLASRSPHRSTEKGRSAIPVSFNGTHR